MYLGSLLGHSNLITGCDFSPDNNTLATVDIDGDLRLWEAMPLEDIDRHPIMRNLLHRRGVHFRKQKRFVEAEQTLRRVLNIQRQSLPHDHPEVEATQQELALVLEEIGPSRVEVSNADQQSRSLSENGAPPTLSKSFEPQLE